MSGVSHPPPSIRLAHVSDVHVTAHGCRWRLRDYASKRLAAWLNLRLLGRAHRFRRTEMVLSCLMAELQRQPPDCVVFSGDATALGFEEELIRASHLMGVSRGQALPGLAVPGNHDYCVDRCQGRFERHFAPWQQGLRIDGQTYPFAVQVGHAWLVAVNSATVNRMPWDASGGVHDDELRRLKMLLAQLQGDGPRILVTHYPVCLSSGRLEGRTHRLRNMRELTEVAAQGGVGLWLHGHRHDAYHHQSTPWTPFPVVCAGSSTQSGLWTYGEYTITNRLLHGVLRTYDLDAGQFREAEHFDLTLR